MRFDEFCQLRRKIMKIKEIHIENFRCIENLEIANADPKMNLIVGVNGSGKTSVLDSLAIALSWMIARMKSTSARGSVPTDKDVRLGSKPPCSITVTTDNGVSWSVRKSKAFSARKKLAACKTDLGEVSVLADQIVAGAENGGSVPVLMYYPVERAIAMVPVNLHKSEPVIWDVYKDALSGNSNFRSFFEWYRRQEDIENEMIRDEASYRDPSLSAVRKAVSLFFPDFSELRVRRRPKQAMVLKKGNETIEFTQLSQGEKCYLSLVCDIARRLSIANPGLENPLEGDGIILIDEVDLHLHPKWQSEVASRLMQVFPNCQFFLSTHSAIVLSDILKRQIIPISGGRRIDVAFEPYGKQANYILNSYFDMPYPRNQAVAQDIEQAFEAVRAGDSEKYRDLYGKLLPIVGASDSDLVNLAIEAKRRGVR